MAIKNKDVVVINYKGKLEDGEIFDASESHGQPLEFEVGSQKVIKGFEDAVVGMEKGETKNFELSPEQAYGEANPELVKEIPKSSLPEGQEPQVGSVLMASSPDGRQFPVKVTEVKDNSLMIDMNHPLAGKKLFFEIEVVDVNPSKEEKSQSTEDVSKENPED